MGTITRPTPIRNSTGTRARWWATESARIGTNWMGIAKTVADIMSRLTACPTCGGTPCPNPRFCGLCCDTDAQKAHGKPPESIPDKCNEMSIEALTAHFDGHRRAHGAPQPTVEALMMGLRERGTGALLEPKVARRVSELSEQQLHEVCGRLQRLKPQIARAWTAEEITTLLDAWNTCHA
jgi:hypothetical protein